MMAGLQTGRSGGAIALWPSCGARYSVPLCGWIGAANVPSSLSLKSRPFAGGGTAAERVLVQVMLFDCQPAGLAAVVHEPDETVAARRLLQQCAEDELPESAWNEKQIEIVVRAWPRPTRWRRSA